MLRSKFVFTRHRSELLLDALRVENRTLDEACFDLQLLAGWVLEKCFDHFRSKTGVLVTPGDPGGAREDVVELCLEWSVLQGVLDERILADLVLDPDLAKLRPKLGDLLHRHSREVEKDGRRHLVEP